VINSNLTQFGCIDLKHELAEVKFLLFDFDLRFDVDETLEVFNCAVHFTLNFKKLVSIPQVLDYQADHALGCCP